jgi:hypothetical protein
MQLFVLLTIKPYRYNKWIDISNKYITRGFLCDKEVKKRQQCEITRLHLQTYLRTPGMWTL